MRPGSSKKAGSFGAVTVATNMAGRGTDILLGDDLDERVTGRFIRMLSERLSTDVHRVRVDCGHGMSLTRLPRRSPNWDPPFTSRIPLS